MTTLLASELYKLLNLGNHVVVFVLSPSVRNGLACFALYVLHIYNNFANYFSFAAAAGATTLY